MKIPGFTRVAAGLLAAPTLALCGAFAAFPAAASADDHDGRADRGRSEQSAVAAPRTVSAVAPTAVSVPEPSPLALLGVGLVGVALLRRRGIQRQP